MSKFNELVTKLRQVFQIDKPDLDFGIYRIINARAHEINEYLEKTLKNKVEQTLAQSTRAEIDQLEKEIEEKKAQYEADGLEAEKVPRFVGLKEKLERYTTEGSQHENAVFSHLLIFFSRYYDNGDFISQRRYKGDTYAIPYSGEEVMLHWANKDQYYIKSGENFSNYSFKLNDGRLVHFRLIDADTAKDNRKDNDTDRRFVLATQRVVSKTDEEGDTYEEEIVPIEEVTQQDESGVYTELVIRFEYKALEKGTKQDALTESAAKAILAHKSVAKRWLDLGQRAPTEKNPTRTLLEKHLLTYTTKNTADYFIHKDLATFLSNELDFYIKNEVMHLDDLQNAQTFSDIEKNLRMIQCLRSIALDLITFLAQIENFQKKLWTKKKFVVSSHYCITLDRVPESFYADIVRNEKQWEQWQKLEVWQGKGAGTVDDLQPFFMVDTSLFTADFKNKLLGTINQIDGGVDGVLIHSDNYQGLNLLQKYYKEKINAIYIDPPYNTSASEIAYKNSYKDSSWLSLVENRIALSKSFLNTDSGKFCCTIDDAEFKLVAILIENIFGELAGTVSIRIKPSGRPIPNGFAISHEYAIFSRSNPSSAISRLKHSEEHNQRYRENDHKGNFFWEMLRKAGSNSNRENRPTMYYPFFYDEKKDILRLPKIDFNFQTGAYTLLEEAPPDTILIFPKKDDGSEGCWYFGIDRAKLIQTELKAVLDENGIYKIYYRRRQNEGIQPTTHWSDSKYSATEHGTALLKHLFGSQEIFSYPKSIFAVIDCLNVMVNKTEKSATYLDFFAGSGTTAHAVMHLNREDAGKRKYILIEQGEYFNTVLKPRIQKVVYASEWKGGEPLNPESGLSHCFKVLKLESYEDTLNNLNLTRTPKQASLLEANPALRDDYQLKYMLDIESRASLLSLNDFKKPFDYKLNIAVDSAGAYEPQSIDLVETFNYLIGLTIDHINAQPERGFITVTGTLPSGEHTLVLWRDCDLLDYEGISALCDKLAINPADNEFDVVYINGDHNIPTVLTQTAEEGGATRVLKLRQIEPEFLNLMFAEDE